MIKRYIHALMLGAPALLVLACQSESAPEGGAAEAALAADEVVLTRTQIAHNQLEVGPLQEHTLEQKVTARGVVDVPPGSRAEVAPFMGGYVKEVRVLPGDWVKKGEVLFTLQNPEYLSLQQQYQEALAALRYLQQDYERQQRLAAEDIASAKGLARAESDFRIKEAQANGLAEQLKMLGVSPQQVAQGTYASAVSVRAPMAGQITTMALSVGGFVSGGTVALRLVNTDHLHLELTVFGQYLQALEKGQRIHFTAPERSEVVYEGEVHLVTEAIDPDTRTVMVHGHVPDSTAEHLRPGLYLEAAIVTAERSALCVPTTAILRPDGSPVVLVHTRSNGEEEVFRQVPVQLGQQDGDWVEVLNARDLEGKSILWNTLLF